MLLIIIPVNLIVNSITSFGERSNDYETVVQYFRAHFLQVHRKNNENRRVLYTHFTSVVVRQVFFKIIVKLTLCGRTRKLHKESSEMVFYLVPWEVCILK